MKTKEFRSALQSIPFTEVTSGTHKDFELWCDNHVVVFDLFCDIEVVYYLPSTYTNPEEFEIKETKELANIKLFPQDSETECTLSDVQSAKLEQEIIENLKVVY